MSIDYKSAGVDIEAGDALVNWLRETQPKEAPHQDRLVSGIGGFASLFRANFQDMKDPCLVTCTDGVGTKLKVASHFEDYSTVGQDLVAMCVNDMVCCGAQPLMFLDYYATGKLDLAAAKPFLHGVREACQASECLLIGGETAEMPGVYQGNDFDCAGFSVGVVDREKALGPQKVKAGQEMVAVASSGFHSNGFSLLRKVFADDFDAWREPLLRPTALYVKLLMALVKSDSVAAAAHITGGGLSNVLRVVPKGLSLAINRWPLSEEYVEVQRRSGLAEAEMLKTFNCGIGMILICDSDQTESVVSLSQDMGHHSWRLGDISAHSEGVDALSDFCLS